MIPGSHTSGRLPFAPEGEALSYRGRSEVAIEVRAGDGAMFVSDLWHRRMPALVGDTGRWFYTIQDKPGVPQLLAAMDGEAFTHKAFAGTHFGGNIVASLRYKVMRSTVCVRLDGGITTPSKIVVSVR